MDLISIIIPVYNVELYLDKCIESIVFQTYANLEIVLVDDGSADKCPEICDNWARKDKRIKVIHKPNGGLSDARNAGLKVAKGKYVAFVDSDDWVDLNLYSVLFEAIQRTNSDIACCKVVKVWNEIPKNTSKSNTAFCEVFDKKNGMLELILDGKIKQIVWNKLYKRLVVSDIWFEVGKYNEDEFWSYQVLGNANQTVVVDYEGYFYLQRNNSIMGSVYSMKRLDAVEAKAIRQEYLSKYFPELMFIGKRNLLYTCLFHGQLVLKNIKKEEKLTALNRLEHVYKMNKLENREINKMVFQDRFWLRMGEICFKLTCILRNLLKIGC